MISESVYRDRYKTQLDSFEKDCNSKLDKYVTPEWNKDDVETMTKYIAMLERYIGALKGVKFVAPTPRFDGEVDAKYKAMQDAIIAKRAEIESEKKRRTEERKTDFEKRKNEVSEYNTSLSAKYKEKHASLLNYKNALSDVFNTYDIKPYDIQLADTITIEEYSALIDQSIQVCEKYTSKRENRLLNRYLELVRSAPNTGVACAYFGATVLVGYLFLPILAVGAFYTMAKSLSNLYNDIDKLRVASKLMSEVNYDRFLDKTALKTFDEELTFDDIEKDCDAKLPEIVDYSNDIAAEKSELKLLVAELTQLGLDSQKRVEEKRDVLVRSLEGALHQLLKDKDDYFKDNPPFPSATYKHPYINHNFVLSHTDEGVDRKTAIPNENILFEATRPEQALANLKLYLCNMMLASEVHSLEICIFDPIHQGVDTTDFTVLRDNLINNMVEEIMTVRKVEHDKKVIQLEAEEKSLKEQIAPYKKKSVMSDEEKDTLSVLEEKLKDVVDSKSKPVKDVDLKAFREDFGRCIYLTNEDDLGKILDAARERTGQNIRRKGSMSVDEYNQIAEREGKEPIGYVLYVCLSGFEKLFELPKDGNDGKDNMFKMRELVRYSPRDGVHFWFIGNVKPLPGLNVISSIQPLPNAIDYTAELGNKALNTYMKSIATYEKTAVSYESTILEKVVPKNKWWTFDTIKGIAMHYGLKDGDFNLMPSISLGDANVHALLGGATGAGKSATINMILCTLICMYPPSELQIIFIDFKNVEAAKFTTGFDTVKNEWMSSRAVDEKLAHHEYFTRLAKIPHLRIISGTTDGEYALSVFEFLLEEQKRRQKILDMARVTKVQELRERILANYNRDKNGNPAKGTWAEMRKDWTWFKANVYDIYGDLPRMLVIFDEFQVMYNPEFVPQKIIGKISDKITAVTKLARAMGMHLWFTSQSMKGTMSKDTMSNFSLRVALRCTKDVSTELIGNPAAGTILDKFGYMYTNDSAGESVEANTFWRIPFLHEAKLAKYIDEMNELCVPMNEQHLKADFYDEKIRVPSDEIFKRYKQYPDTFMEPNTLILGERAAFSTNKSPIAINLNEDIGENILVHGFDRSDIMNLAMTFVDNMKAKGDSVYMILNSGDKDTHSLLAIDEICDPMFSEFAQSTADFMEMFEQIEAMVNGRKERGGPFKKCYIIAIQWERSYPGNSKFIDKFVTLAREAPLVGVHFIWIYKEKLDTDRQFTKLANHKIAAFSTVDAMFFIGDDSSNKFPNDDEKGRFATYLYGADTYKFRIYQHKFTRELQSRMVIIE